MQRRLPLLVTTGAELPPRQRTMRDAIGWSYELLTDAERRIFRRLSVFRGSFGAELARTVAGEAGHDVLQTLRAVAVLVDHNVLQVIDADDGEPRFVFLEMVREYAAELLAQSDESEATYLRLGHSALAAAGLFRSNLPAAQLRPKFESLMRESATFDAVLTWARDTGHAELGLRLVVQLWDFWWFCGSYAQAAAWLEALLTLTESGSTEQAVATVSDELLAKAYITAAGVAEARGRFSDGEVFAGKALPLKRKIGDLAAVAALLSGMGVAASERGDFTRARELLGEGLEIRRDLRDEFAIGKSLFDLGQNAGNEGNIAAAQRHLEDSLQCFRNVDSQLGLAFVFAFLGIIAARGGLADRAESFGREALRLGQAVGHQAVIAQESQTLAAAALHRGAYDEAERATSSSNPSGPRSASKHSRSNLPPAKRCATWRRWRQVRYSRQVRCRTKPLRSAPRNERIDVRGVIVVGRSAQSVSVRRAAFARRTRQTRGRERADRRRYRVRRREVAPRNDAFPVGGGA